MTGEERKNKESGWKGWEGEVTGVVPETGRKEPRPVTVPKWYCRRISSTTCTDIVLTGFGTALRLILGLNLILEGP
jgi:hypothetical protein